MESNTDRPQPRISRPWFVALGWVLIGLGLVLNEWTLARLFSPDGEIGSSGRTAVLIFDVVMVAWGICVPRYRLARHMLLAACSVAFAWLASEAVFVTSGALIPSEFNDRQDFFVEYLEPDERLGFRPKPHLRDFELSWLDGEVSGVYNTDAFGFRNVGRDYESAPLFVLGDSFVWGSWVDRSETFYGIVESTLEQPAVSLGVGSYGVFQYEVLFDAFVVPNRPEQVLLCLFANDLSTVDTLDTAKAWFEKNSSTYQPPSAYERTLLSKLVYRVGEMDWRVGSETQARPTTDGLMLYPQRGAHPRYIGMRHFVEVESAVARMIETARAHDIELTIILVPSKEWVYREDYDRLFGDQGPYLENEAEGFRRLLALAQEQDVAAIDLTAALRLARSAAPQYFVRDPHWNRAGHRTAARAVLSAVAGRGL